MADSAIDQALKQLRDLTELELPGARPHEARGKPSEPGSGSRGTTATNPSSSPGSAGAEAARLGEIAALSAQLLDEERYESALDLVVEEFELSISVHGESHPRTLQALSTYAGVLWQLGRGSDARELLEELVAKRAQARPPTSLTTRHPARL